MSTPSDLAQELSEPASRDISTTALPQLHEIILATTRYLQTLTELTDADFRAPSALPGWSRGHVVTHLCRNADGLARLLHWAQTGEETTMYVSDEARDADIEAGAGRSADVLREDAAASWGRLLQAANELHGSRLDAPVSRTPGSAAFPVRRVGSMRRTEVEVHHADLLGGYTARDWPADFTAFLLRRRRRELGDRSEVPTSMTWRLTDTGETLVVGDGEGTEITGTAADVAWWAIGRGNGDGLTSSTGSLPDLGRWS